VAGIPIPLTEFDSCGLAEMTCDAVPRLQTKASKLLNDNQNVNHASYVLFQNFLSGFEGHEISNIDPGENADILQTSLHIKGTYTSDGKKGNHSECFSRIKVPE
jgi:hypothetical protein